MPPLSSPSSLIFASFLNYSPRGRSEVSQSSKTFALKLKANRVVVPASRTTAAEYLVSRIAPEQPGGSLTTFFRPSDAMVPVPTSAVSKPGTVWPALEIAKALVAAGLGCEVVQMLGRRQPMRKSAYAPAGGRPTIEEHLESLSVHGSVAVGDRLVLVDDLVTKGTTLFACAMALRRIAPTREVVAFAAMRTLGLQPEIDRIAEPVVGQIRFINGEMEREP